MLAAAALATQLDTNAAVVQVNLDPDIDLTSGFNYNLDMDGDGITDFTFREESNYGYSAVSYVAEVICPAGNSVLARSSSMFPDMPAVLSNGDVISAGGTWYGGVGVLFSTGAYGFYTGPFGAFDYGNWNSDEGKYLGVRFDIAGAQHYGYIRLTLDLERITILAYGYEDVAGVPIAVPQCDDAPVPYGGPFAGPLTSGGKVTIYWTEEGGEEWQVKGGAAGAPVSNIVLDTNLVKFPYIPMVEYRWKVRAKCPDGSISEWSDIESFTIPMLLDHAGERLHKKEDASLMYLAGPFVPASGEDQLTVYIYDLNGRLRFTSILNSGAAISHNLPEGVYAVVVQ